MRKNRIPITARFPPQLMEDLERYRLQVDLNRSDAIRELVNCGLRAENSEELGIPIVNSDLGPMILRVLSQVESVRVEATLNSAAIHHIQRALNIIADSIAALTQVSEEILAAKAKD